ncbi:MAG: imidazole glycerol phosphate synthase subunit HisH [Polyangiaceae bacterium]
MKLAILDLGIGNLHSLAKAYAAAGADVSVTTNIVKATSAELLALPGVGAFSAASASLGESGRVAVRAALAGGLPCIGVCLGMQLLFESSEEGDGAGLSVFEGHVVRLACKRTPHMGWSRLDAVAPSPAPRALPLPTAVYYAHSFACAPRDPSLVVATSTVEGVNFPAIVQRARVVGCQFHPEKSSRPGLALLAALVEAVR